MREKLVIMVYMGIYMEFYIKFIIMRIKLIKERKDMYFAKMIGRSDVYAQ
jgi:hypothetical protein